MFLRRIGGCRQGAAAAAPTRTAGLLRCVVSKALPGCSCRGPGRPTGGLRVVAFLPDDPVDGKSSSSRNGSSKSRRQQQRNTAADHQQIGNVPAVPRVGRPNESSSKTSISADGHYGQQQEPNEGPQSKAQPGQQAYELPGTSRAAGHHGSNDGACASSSGDMGNGSRALEASGGHDGSQQGQHAQHAQQQQQEGEERSDPSPWPHAHADAAATAHADAGGACNDCDNGAPLVLGDVRLAPGPLGRYAYERSFVRVRSKGAVTLASLGHFSREMQERMLMYVDRLHDSDIDAERAAETIRQWSEGTGVNNIDVRLLGRHFLRATLLKPVVSELLPAALLDTGLTALAFATLEQYCSQVPYEVPLMLRGALILVVLILLTAFSSNAVKSIYRLVKVTIAAVHFADDAPYVLAAMCQIADGRGALRRRTQDMASKLLDGDVDPEVLLDALDTMMQHVKAKSGYGGDSNTSGADDHDHGHYEHASSAGSSAPSSRTIAPHADMQHTEGTSHAGAALMALPGEVSSASSQQPPAQHCTLTQPRSKASSFTSQPPSSSLPLEDSETTPQPSMSPSLPPPQPSSSSSSSSSSSLLSSLNTFLVRQQALHMRDFDPVSELGMSQEEAAAAAEAFSRYADAQRRGVRVVGVYGMARLAKECGAPPLSTAELELAVRLCSRAKEEERSSLGAGITYEDWVHWWCRTQ